MIDIFAEWKRYNANSNDNRVGDCVKRALSYAYGVDYDEISRQLNRIKRDTNSYAYNTTRVFTEFLKKNGAVKIPWQEFDYSPKNAEPKDPISEEQFAASHPNGIYVLLTGPEKKEYSTHMVCIMNGDIIDSWNSSNYIVREGWEIKDASLDVSDVTWEDVVPELNEFIDSYLASVEKKYSDWFRVWRSSDGYASNPETYTMKFILKTEDLPQDSNYYGDRKYTHRVVIKVNPRMSVEKNIESLKVKLKQKVYDWVYAFQKDKRDTLAIQDMETHPKYYNDAQAKKDLLKLPEWCRKYVKYFWENPSSYSWSKFELSMDALPDDPYYEAFPTLRLEADSLGELKRMLEAYHENYARPGKDY